MRLLRFLLGAFAFGPAALLGLVLARQAAAGELPLPALELAAVFAWLVAVISVSLLIAMQALTGAPRACGRSPGIAAGPGPSVAGGPGASLAEMILPDVETRVARVHRALDAIEARSVAQLAELQGRRPAEVKALADFADRLSTDVRSTASRREPG